MIDYARITVANLLNLAELPHEILKQSAKAGVVDDSTVIVVTVRR